MLFVVWRVLLVSVLGCVVGVPCVVMVKAVVVFWAACGKRDWWCCGCGPLWGVCVVGRASVHGGCFPCLFGPRGVAGANKEASTQLLTTLLHRIGPRAANCWPIPNTRSRLDHQPTMGYVCPYMLAHAGHHYGFDGGYGNGLLQITHKNACDCVGLVSHLFGSFLATPNQPW